ncbi:DUF2218 domain-containing protein [Nocardia sp. NPDC052112]|uniref:DUF2218 domain-containing protein n=1 Tax=Nocardia sp. NPDC052112 TaxID=3155646 RepID=UPI00341A8324
MATERAARYVKQFVGHWGEHTERIEDGESIVMYFDADDRYGAYTVHFEADEHALTIRVRSQTRATTDAIAEVVADHLGRFARRENLNITWTQ